MIAYCGLNCQTCDAYIATKNDDDDLRFQTSKKWSEQFNVDIKPEFINCTGCKSDGIRFFHCDNTCKIRRCCNEKKIQSCIECGSFPCDDIKFVVDNSDEARANLEKLKSV